MKKEGIFKMMNGAMEKIKHEQFIIRESWRKTRDRIQRENPLARVKYSYKTQQFTIIFGLPSDFKLVKWGLNEEAPPKSGVLQAEPITRSVNDSILCQTCSENPYEG